MRIFLTVDQQGVDGFGFGEDDKRLRVMRAQANAFRGMEFWECEILEEDRKHILDMFKNAKFVEAKKWLAIKRV